MSIVKLFRDLNQVDTEKYMLVDYFLSSSTTLRDAAWCLAIGQSVGNPAVRNKWETDELFESHACIILADEEEISKVNEGNITIAFPACNLDLSSDGISQLLCHVMGGQLDIDIVKKCHVLDITFPTSCLKHFSGPKFGISGIREFTGQRDKPILGGIVKPKIGISPEVLLEMVKQLVEGGVDFIKEDEIMSNPSFCSLQKRLPPIMEYLKGKNVIYAVCINSDHHHILDRVKTVHSLGGNAVHVNFWSGLGVYKAIRDLDLPLFLFFQKSGDKILTNPNHDYHISWNLVCKLATLSGVDMIHAGMWGGYLSDDENNLKKVLATLHSNNTLPSLSCGMHAGLISAINSRFGVDYLANCGGSIHGHPGGTTAGAKALRQAIDQQPGHEYEVAVQKWDKLT